MRLDLRALKVLNFFSLTSSNGWLGRYLYQRRVWNPGEHLWCLANFAKKVPSWMFDWVLNTPLCLNRCVRKKYFSIVFSQTIQPKLWTHTHTHIIYIYIYIVYKIYILCRVYVMFFKMIWYYLYNLKNVKNTHGRGQLY